MLEAPNVSDPDKHHVPPPLHIPHGSSTAEPLQTPSQSIVPTQSSTSSQIPSASASTPSPPHVPVQS